MTHRHGLGGLKALTAQIVNSSVRVRCDDGKVLRALRRYLNDAIHRVPLENHIEVTIDFDGIEYVLSSGRREISPEVAAEAAWEELASRLGEAFAGFLQIRGLCLDSNGRRLLIVVDEAHVLGALTMHCLFGGLDVPSTIGVCLRGGLATPYALPIEVSEHDFLRFRRATGLEINAPKNHDEMGAVRYQVAPIHFGRRWIVEARRIDSIVVLKWNPGGWSGFGKRHNHWLLEQILGSAHMPSAADTSSKLHLLAEARSLAASVPSVDLHLGSLEDAPLLLMDYFRDYSGA